MTLDELNRAPAEDARVAFERCCGAAAWVERMCATRPFRNLEGLFRTADHAARSLRPDDWREAFAHHPKIGDRATLEQRFPTTSDWAADEQRGAATATSGTLDALAAANEAYERKFGYIFIVCATGRSAKEMLALLNQRLSNDPAIELPIAAKEQMKITRLRLEKLLASPQ